MQLRAWVCAFGLATAAWSPLAHGAVEIPSDSVIQTVTVFPDRAEVTRHAEVEVPIERSVAVIADLPATLIDGSLRVRATAGANVLIGSVELRQVYAASAVQDDERRLIGEIEALEDQSRAQQDQIAAARVRLEFVTAIGHDMAGAANGEILNGRVDPVAWEHALGVLGEGAVGALETIRTAEIRQRGLGRQIEQKRRQLEQIRTGQTAQSVAHVHLEAGAATPVELWVTYQVPGASWRPRYDARLDAEAGSVELKQIGEVRQVTGEDWSDVELILSTARPGAGAQMPDLASWFIDIAEAVALRERGEAVRGNLLADQLRAMAPAEEDKATVVSTAVAASYHVPGPANVPSEDAAHSFALSERTMPAALAVRVVPKVVPAGYLYGTIDYAGEEPLLPGPVAIFRDGMFVGTSAMGLLRPGEELRLSFGIDDRVRVDYRLETGERSRGGLINRHQRQERRYRIEVANHHTQAIEITVLDQLPVPQDERIEVELLGSSTEPTGEDVDARLGVLAWTHTYAPNEERAILFRYAATHPEGARLVGF